MLCSDVNYNIIRSDLPAEQDVVLLITLNNADVVHGLITGLTDHVDV